MTRTSEDRLKKKAEDFFLKARSLLKESAPALEELHGLGEEASDLARTCMDRMESKVFMGRSMEPGCWECRLRALEEVLQWFDESADGLSWVKGYM